MAPGGGNAAHAATADMLLRRILQAMRRSRLRKRAAANFFSPPQKHGTRRGDAAIKAEKACRSEFLLTAAKAWHPARRCGDQG
jgi:hypothetical protein